MKYTFNKFCKIGQAPEQSWRRSRETVVKRLKELRDMLCKLGRELPWLRGGEVEPNTVVKLVDDILKNRYALLTMAVRNYEQQLQNETQTTQTTECDNEPSDSNRSDSPSSKTPELVDPGQAECDKEPSDSNRSDSPSSKTPELVDPGQAECDKEPSDSNRSDSPSSKTPELVDPGQAECDKEPSDSNRSDSPSSKTPELVDPGQAECDKEATDDQLPPNHWSKRHLFLPPCVKSRKRQRVDAPQLEVTGDEDISDSEIESYIRSQDEIETFRKVQKELKDA